LLWLLSELYEHLPEVGDLPKPKLVFFFDEAHLLFDDAPKALLDKIEQVVRLVRSKGVGVFFVTQNPLDIPDAILGQLGNRVQHALRAYTPRDQKAVRAAAETFRPNPALDTAQAITELGVGEALVSFLDEHGSPGVVRRAFVLPPASQIGAIDMTERAAIMARSLVAGVYDTAVDRESAYEKLASRVTAVAQTETSPRAQQEAPAADSPGTGLGGMLGGLFGKGGRSDSALQAMVKNAARSIGSQVGREIVRGVLGSIFKGKSSRR
jgi:DNA helicase HerA-like ATPase